MVIAHSILYLPRNAVRINPDGTWYGIGSYEKYSKAQEEAVSYVLSNVDRNVVYRNPAAGNAPGISEYASINYDDAEGLDVSVRNIFSKYKSRPILLFVDFDNSHILGILKGNAVTYDNIVDMYKLFTRADYNLDSNVYELKTPKGDVIPFVFDETNSHLVMSENGPLVPNHSLLDLLYVGANLGVFDRPYLRDWFNKVLAGYKDELIDLGILALAAAGAGTAIISKNKKYKIGGAGVAAVSGSVFGYRVYTRQKKQKEAAK